MIKFMGLLIVLTGIALIAGTFYVSFLQSNFGPAFWGFIGGLILFAMGTGTIVEKNTNKNP